jgi:NAD(P)-dependent dehydrogenase (short-subunit alcohol dehydrogenase family)
MREFRGRVAVVTGGASGVGRALGQRFAREGMNVVLADVEKGALEATVGELREDGLAVEGVMTDVTSQESVDALARHCFERHGAIHVVCNNAGIGTDESRTMLWEAPANDWTWALRVNVWGVIHGIKAFVPRMLQGGQEGHIVNTSSANGGLVLLPTTPIYASTKSVVTTLSEALHLQLRMARAKLAAHVLFPGPHVVATNIFSAARNRPADLPLERELPPPPTLDDLRQWAERAGREFRTTSPDEVAEHALEGIRTDQFWILPPSPELDTRIRARLEGILARRSPELSLL